MENYNEKTSHQALAEASNLIYNLIISETITGEDDKLWKLKDALFDELERQILNKESIEAVLDELANQPMDYNDCE